MERVTFLIVFRGKRKKFCFRLQEISKIFKYYLMCKNAKNTRPQRCLSELKEMKQRYWVGKHGKSAELVSRGESINAMVLRKTYASLFTLVVQL